MGQNNDTSLAFHTFNHWCLICSGWEFRCFSPHLNCLKYKVLGVHTEKYLTLLQMKITTFVLLLIINLIHVFLGAPNCVCIHSQSDLHGPRYAHCPQRGEKKEQGGGGKRGGRGRRRPRRRWRRRWSWRETREERGTRWKWKKWKSLSRSNSPEGSAAADICSEYTDTQHHGGKCHHFCL